MRCVVIEREGDGTNDGAREWIVMDVEWSGSYHAPHRNLAFPDILRLLWHKAANIGVDVAWRDGVGAGELDPLDGQRAAYLYKNKKKTSVEEYTHTHT